MKVEMIDYEMEKKGEKREKEREMTQGGEGHRLKWMKVTGQMVSGDEERDERKERKEEITFSSSAFDFLS